MSFQPTPTDIAVAITTPSTSSHSDEPRLHSERRITPTWTLQQVKSKLETMTGVPPSSQRLRLKTPGLPDQWVEGDDSIIGNWGLARGSEIEVYTPWFSTSRSSPTLLVSVGTVFYKNTRQLMNYKRCRSTTHVPKRHESISPTSPPSRNMSSQVRHTRASQIQFSHGKRIRS